MSSGHFKHDLFAQFARIGKALGHGNRLEILEFLAQGERSVDDLAGVSGLTIANTSRHLQLLRQAGLVKARKAGLKVYYSLNGDDIDGLVDVLRRVAKRHLAEVDRLVDSYLLSKDGLEPVSAGELLERARQGLVTILDVRPPEEFDSGHLVGAVNIPLDELEQRLTQLTASREIVAYCRGPYCVLAFEAVARLRDKGFDARRLEYGYPEWKRAGLPVERTPAPST